MTDGEIERAMAIGRENQELISLGLAWCTHIRTDRSGLGVGMVEEMTGLPITGGRFTCDYARNPVGLSGMQLAAGAVSFYEGNCQGCEHRSPGNRIPNLSTWAEPILEARRARDHEVRQGEERATAEQASRAAHRTLIGASMNAISQQVVALINRLDANRSDVDAAEALGAAARLTPEAFSEELVAMLYIDAESLSSSVLLDVLLRLEGTADPDRLHDLCVRAVRDGWGRAEGCRHLSQVGRADDLDDDFLMAVISHAASSGWSVVRRRRGNPAALRRYHSLASETVERALASLLRNGQSWRRAAGAAAAHELAADDPSVLSRLLPALLDGLRYEEDRYDHEDASEHIASCVSVVLVRWPLDVQTALDARWSRATPEYRTRLIECLDHLVRHAQQEVAADVARVIIARAVTALSEPYDRERHGIEDDYQRRASYLLKYAVAHAPTSELSLDVLLGLLLVWIGRQREIADWAPEGPMSVLQKMGSEAHIGGLVREIAEAVTVAGHRDRAAFVSACREVFAGTHVVDVRAEVTRMLGDVASGSAASTEVLADAMPMIYTAMLGEEQAVRAAGLEAAQAVMRALPAESIPPLLGRAVVAGLTDQYLIVVAHAVEAVHRVPIDLVDADAVSLHLMLVAQAYASDRLRDRMVRDAISGSLRFARPNDTLYRAVLRMALQVVGKMHPFNARDTLRWSQSLREEPGWADAAIHALRPDPDPQYEYLGDDDKGALLAELGRRVLTTGQVESLFRHELAGGKRDRGRALLGADTLAELGRPDLAALVLRAHLDEIPQTMEQERRRRAVLRWLLQFELETAIASEENQRVTEIVEEVLTLAAPDESD